MRKFSTESIAGQRRASSYGTAATETMPDGGRGTEPPPAQRVDPSVRLGDIKGDILGNVPMSVQMAKPQAYIPKKGSP